MIPLRSELEEQLRRSMQKYSGAWTEAYNQVPSIRDLPPLEHHEATANRCKEIEAETLKEAISSLESLIKKREGVIIEEAIDVVNRMPYRTHDGYNWIPRAVVRNGIAELRGDTP